MANPIELAIRVKADTKKLWDDLTRVDRKADETKRKIQDVGRESARVANQANQQARIRPGAARFGQGLGAAGGVLAAGGDLNTAFAALLGATFPELAAIVAGIRGGGAVGDWLRGTKGELKAAEFRALNPTSVADELAAIRESAGKRAAENTLGNILGRLVQSEHERAKDLEVGEFRKLVRRNPALALDVLARAGSPAAWRKVYDDETRKMAEESTRSAASDVFMARYQTNTTTVNAAVNVVSTVGAGRGSVGRTLTEYQDSRDRNNGRYVATSSRRR